MFKRVLVANRGEIALRIIKTLKNMGIHSIAVYSDADKTSAHVLQADSAVAIGPALSRKSYLNIDAIINAAKTSRADAIHPGYGFLSENSAFAHACEKNNIVFIGPSGDCIARAGNKAEARKGLDEKGYPIIPGSTGPVLSFQDGAQLAERIGYPVIIKASGGGGGRGMRIADSPDALKQSFSIASAEAKAAFENPDVYIEKYIEKPRHIEVQILGDHHGNFVFLGERECSIQMRYQKLIEEAPSPFVDALLRKRLGDTAIQIAQHFGYTNAGTVEFLVDGNKNFYFMEVNARVQVEHPVTELVTGIDIVQQQVLIAAGLPLAFSQKQIDFNGWAMECRINACDPDNGFMPSPGEISTVRFPKADGVRVDTHIHDNYFVPPFYDSLIAKLIVWDKDRPSAINKMLDALENSAITGIETTLPFYPKVFRHPAFQKGEIDTHFMATYFTP